MLGWVKRWLGAAYYEGDLRKTFLAVDGLPLANQRRVAVTVLNELALASACLAAVEERDLDDGPRALWGFVERGKELRHAALDQGAASRADARWAAASIFETWAVGATGSIGRRAQGRIENQIGSFCEDVLTDDEMESLANFLTLEDVPPLWE